MCKAPQWDDIPTQNHIVGSPIWQINRSICMARYYLWKEKEIDIFFSFCHLANRCQMTDVLSCRCVGNSGLMAKKELLLCFFLCRRQHLDNSLLWGTYDQQHRDFNKGFYTLRALIVCRCCIKITWAVRRGKQRVYQPQSVYSDTYCMSNLTADGR